MTGITILVFLSFTLTPLYFTNHDYYYGIVSKDSIIYGATNGGVVKYNYLLDEFHVLTNTDGLLMNRQNCITVDSAGFIWTGCGHGLAQISMEFSRIRIYPVGCLPCVAVNTIFCLKDTLLVGTSSGLLMIDTRGTPEDFDDDATLKIYDINVKSIWADSNFWIGTTDGVIRFSKDFTNSRVYTTADGLLNNFINKILIYDSVMYVASNSGINRLSADHFDTLLSGYYVQDMAPAGDSLLLALDSFYQVGIFYMDSLRIINNGLPIYARVNDVENIEGSLFCGIGNRWLDDYFGEGIGVYNADSASWKLIKDTCLGSNHIADITANENGIFIAHGRRSNESKGISWLKNDGAWQNYSWDPESTYINNIHRCVTAKDGKVWFALNPFPDKDTMVMFFSFNPSNNEWHYFRNRFNGMDGTNAVWDLEFDLNNNLYLSLAGLSNKPWVIDSSLKRVSFLGGAVAGFRSKIAIDSSARVWITLSGHDDGGVWMIDTRGTLFERGDDISRIYGPSDGFLSINALGCIVDENNMLYIANQAGLVIYNGSRFTGIANISEGDIFDVELDKNERVWLMTRTGIYFFDPAYRIWDGWTYLELGVVLDFLPSADEYIQIQGFEFDPLRKCFWLGGETGLLKLEIQEDFVPTLDAILIYPNPAVAGGIVRIKNIPADVEISIYSLSGRLIAKDLTPNELFAEVTWKMPANVPSGLYFALIKSGNNKKICKFAIVK